MTFFRQIARILDGLGQKSQIIFTPILLIILTTYAFKILFTWEKDIKQKDKKNIYKNNNVQKYMIVMTCILVLLLYPFIIDLFKTGIWNSLIAALLIIACVYVSKLYMDWDIIISKKPFMSYRLMSLLFLPILAFILSVVNVSIGNGWKKVVFDWSFLRP